MEAAGRKLRFMELSSGLKMSQGLSPSPSPDAVEFPGASNSTLYSKVVALWSSPRGTIYRIEFIVLVAAVALCFLATFGSHRRRRKSLFIQKGVFGVFSLSTSLLTYILGSMQSSEVKSTMYPFWAVSLYLLYVSTNAIEDNQQQSRLLYQSFEYYLYVLFLGITVCQFYGPHPGQIAGTWIFPSLCVMAMLRSNQRIVACHLANNSWNFNKMVADYMHDEDNMKGTPDPSTLEGCHQTPLQITMEGCHYLVDWPLSKTDTGAPSHRAWSQKDRDQVVDIQRVWKCNDISLSPELKYTCLSFSMFHLLRRRSFGFACTESKDWAPDIVWGMLSTISKQYWKGDIDRVFKVIEVELAFMYDFFFTKYATLYYGPGISRSFWPLATAVLISYATYLAFIPMFILTYGDPAHGVQGVYIHLQKDEVAVTLMLVASVISLELLQLLFYWRSIWGRVSFVCEHLRGNRGCMMKVKELLTSWASNQQLWQDRIGQYSLIESVSYSSKPFDKNHESLWTKYIRFCSKLGGVPGPVFLIETNHHVHNIRGKQEKPIEVGAEVKNALVQSLVRSGGKVSMGGSSLEENGDLKWLYMGKMHSDTSSSILIWHIATCYCEMAQEPSAPSKSYFDIAQPLSKYCAYLVVHAHEFLPGHPYDTKCVFDAAALEAVKHLSCCKDKHQKYSAMNVLASSRETVFERGVELGKQLEKMEITQRWKVLADFWADTMLYIAPSDNVKGHMEQLANGGEFITHLWALLSHAGILKREEQRYTTETREQSTQPEQPGT